MAKTSTMCDEVGCVREWVTMIKETASFTMTAPVSLTAFTKKVCELCAKAHERQKLLFN